MIKSFGGRFFFGYRLLEVGKLRESIVGFAHASQRFGHFALRHGGVLARDQRGGGALAFFNFVLQINDLLLERIAALRAESTAVCREAICLSDSAFFASAFLARSSLPASSAWPARSFQSCDCLTYF